MMETINLGEAIRRVQAATADEHRKVRFRRYYLSHREEVLEKKRAYYRNNREAIRKRNQDYYQRKKAERMQRVLAGSPLQAEAIA
jgi:hypothetical protein